MGKFYSKEELKYIEKNWRFESDRKIGERLGRTAGAIKAVRRVKGWQISKQPKVRTVDDMLKDPNHRRTDCRTLEQCIDKYIDKPFFTCSGCIKYKC